MKKVSYQDLLSLLRREIEEKEKKQALLDEVNKKLKLLDRVLNYKGKQNVSKYFQNVGITRFERFFHKKPKVCMGDMYGWTYDIVFFAKRIKNMSPQQRTLFYQYTFGNISTKVQDRFVRDVTEFKKLAGKSNLSKQENLMLTKSLINITTSLSMMFHSYYKLQDKQKELQNEITKTTTLSDLKRLLQKLEYVQYYYFTEKDKRILLALESCHKKRLKQLEIFCNQHNHEWKQQQEEKKKILSEIKKIEVSRHIVSKNANKMVTLVKEDTQFDKVIPVELQKEKENVYVTSLFQLLKLEANLESLESYLPTVEFKDYYLLRDGLLRKVEEEIEELNKIKKDVSNVEERSYLEEEVLRLRHLFESLEQYFQKQEIEQQELPNETIFENEIIYLLQPSGIPYIMKDIKNQLEKEQIPYFIKALNRIKQGTVDFDIRKLNKFKEGKGYFGASDVFEAKAGQIRILFQYLGDHKVAVLMYFIKKDNHTTVLLREMMKERIANCEEQVQTLRKKITNHTLDSTILKQSYETEQELLEMFATKDKKVKKNYSLR